MVNFFKNLFASKRPYEVVLPIEIKNLLPNINTASAEMEMISKEQEDEGTKITVETGLWIFNTYDINCYGENPSVKGVTFMEHGGNLYKVMLPITKVRAILEGKEDITKGNSEYRFNL